MIIKHNAMKVRLSENTLKRIIKEEVKHVMLEWGYNDEGVPNGPEPKWYIMEVTYEDLADLIKAYCKDNGEYEDEAQLDEVRQIALDFFNSLNRKSIKGEPLGSYTLGKKEETFQRFDSGLEGDLKKFYQANEDVMRGLGFDDGDYCMGDIYDTILDRDDWEEDEG